MLWWFEEIHPPQVEHLNIWFPVGDKLLGKTVEPSRDRALWKEVLQ